MGGYPSTFEGDAQLIRDRLSTLKAGSSLSLGSVTVPTFLRAFAIDDVIKHREFDHGIKLSDIHPDFLDGLEKFESKYPKKDYERLHAAIRYYLQHVSIVTEQPAVAPPQNVQEPPQIYEEPRRAAPRRSAAGNNLDLRNSGDNKTEKIYLVLTQPTDQKKFLFEYVWGLTNNHKDLEFSTDLKMNPIYFTLPIDIQDWRQLQLKNPITTSQYLYEDDHDLFSDPSFRHTHIFQINVTPNEYVMFYNIMENVMKKTTSTIVKMHLPHKYLIYLKRVEGNLGPLIGAAITIGAPIVGEVISGVMNTKSYKGIYNDSIESQFYDDLNPTSRLASSLV